jgi:hypothetical protein
MVAHSSNIITANVGLRRPGIHVPLSAYRNFLMHGQNTIARPELQLLITLILLPGWRKAHVVCSPVSF